MGAAFPVGKVLYPGSFVDIAPSFVFPAVTYVDVDQRAQAFFDDTPGVFEIVGKHSDVSLRPAIEFLLADYTEPLDLPDDTFDLLISLYAGPVSDYCTRYLKPGGLLLANSSHGDAALAAIDRRLELIAIVAAHDGSYRIKTDDLQMYMVPKSDQPLTRSEIRARGRGVAYTKQAFAYMFRRSV